MLPRAAGLATAAPARPLARAAAAAPGAHRPCEARRRRGQAGVRRHQWGRAGGRGFRQRDAEEKRTRHEAARDKVLGHRPPRNLLHGDDPRLHLRDGRHVLLHHAENAVAAWQHDHLDLRVGVQLLRWNVEVEGQATGRGPIVSQPRRARPQPPRRQPRAQARSTTQHTQSAQHTHLADSRRTSKLEGRGGPTTGRQPHLERGAAEGVGWLGTVWVHVHAHVHAHVHVMLGRA